MLHTTTSSPGDTSYMSGDETMLRGIPLRGVEEGGWDGRWGTREAGKVGEEERKRMKKRDWKIKEGGGGSEWGGGRGSNTSAVWLRSYWLLVQLGHGPASHLLQSEQL